MLRDDLVAYLDEVLHIHTIHDYGPQGLQVAGRTQVGLLAVGVDAALATIDGALTAGADMLLVHHGVLWGEAQRLVGAYGRKLRRLITTDLNLYAAHLALDAHPQWGNNAELCRLLGLEIQAGYHAFQGVDVGVIAAPTTELTFVELAQRFHTAVAAPIQVDAYGPPRVRRLAVCSGDAARSLVEAQALGCDTLVTGERDYTMAHAGREMGMNVLYGGHYATETLGVKALARHLAVQFDLPWVFIDVPVDQ
ncbi:MAG: Nif3-like dinuclear metal center hexameric protein [Chloroflexi bacterium]|nr:Nif3-like dinuclear metal center hexameric protein [Chloroflexota bacterium]